AAHATRVQECALGQNAKSSPPGKDRHVVLDALPPTSNSPMLSKERATNAAPTDTFSKTCRTTCVNVFVCPLPEYIFGGIWPRKNAPKPLNSEVFSQRHDVPPGHLAEFSPTGGSLNLSFSAATPAPRDSAKHCHSADTATPRTLR